MSRGEVFFGIAGIVYETYFNLLREVRAVGLAAPRYLVENFVFDVLGISHRISRPVRILLYRIVFQSPKRPHWQISVPTLLFSLD